VISSRIDQVKRRAVVDWTVMIVVDGREKGSSGEEVC
jgi:hypothetical protein